MAAAWLGALGVNRSLVAVQGHSMLPTLWPGDRVLTVPALTAPRAGHLVVVRDPAERTHLVVKRVHAVDAEGVDVRGDNPAASTDSRTWGPLPTTSVRRRVVRRWPDLRTQL
ncbi:MAG: nickel-type superoxide dismutase maturation protease [Egicoccus sp.]